MLRFKDKVKEVARYDSQNVATGNTQILTKMLHQTLSNQ